MMVTLAYAWLHTIDPFAVHVKGDFGLRWYGLSYAVGFMIAWVIIRWWAKRGRTPLPAAWVGDLLFAMIVGVLIGGRLGYALFYKPQILWGFTPSAPWWDFFAINKGGMASHGGMIGVIIACIVFAKRRNLPAFHLFDLAAFTSTIGLGLGRIANFINGELLGFPIANQQSAPWWSVKFPHEMRDWSFATHHDAYLRLADAATVMGKAPSEYIAAVDDAAAGSQPAQQWVYGVVEQVITAIQSGNAQVAEIVKPLLLARYPSQLIQALTDGPMLVLVLLLIWVSPRRPGVISAWFLILYGVLRIATEQFRMPDAGVSLIAGLSRGRVLSIVMILGGFALLALVMKLKAKPLPGPFTKIEGGPSTLSP